MLYLTQGGLRMEQDYGKPGALKISCGASRPTPYKTSPCEGAPGHV